MTASQSLNEAYDPLGAHRQDPYPFYARVRQREPVFFAPELGVWVVSRHEDVRSVLRRTEEFSSANSFRASVRPGPAAMAVLRTGYPPAHAAVTADGDEHRRLRAPFAEAMTPERVDALVPAIQAHADTLVDAIASAGSGELVGDVVRPLALRTIAAGSSVSTRRTSRSSVMARTRLSASSICRWKRWSRSLPPRPMSPISGWSLSGCGNAAPRRATIC